MFAAAVSVYRVTRKKHDQLFNTFVMRPVAAVAVAGLAGTSVTPNQVTLANFAVFLVAAALLVLWPSWAGGVAAAFVLEVSYCLDCADGMLARYKGLASKTGHLLDFFTDEIKAILLVASLSVRAWRVGGLGVFLQPWERSDPRFLLGGIAGAVVVSSAISLTNFVRRPELSGRETTVEAFYETSEAAPTTWSRRRASWWVTTFLRWVNHYPSHIWLWALVGRMEVYLWVYVVLNALYLARGWVGLALRFGRG